MTSLDLLAELRKRNVKISLAGDKLRLEAPAGALTPELKKAIAEHKAGLVELLLSNAKEPDEWDPDQALALFTQAYEEANRFYVAGAWAWAEKHRPDLLRTVTDAEGRFNRAYKTRDMAGCEVAARAFVRGVLGMVEARKAH